MQKLIDKEQKSYLIHSLFDFVRDEITIIEEEKAGKETSTLPMVCNG
jgi:hypothetical protein